jgi:hypothetical protein
MTNPKASPPPSVPSAQGEASERAAELKRLADTMSRACATLAKARHFGGDIPDALEAHRDAQIALHAAIDRHCAGSGAEPVVSGRRPWWMRRDVNEHDWPEDFQGENGCYECNCIHCGERFHGYKRRVTCKACDPIVREKLAPIGATLNEGPAASPAPAEPSVTWTVARDQQSPLWLACVTAAKAVLATARQMGARSAYHWDVEIEGFAAAIFKSIAASQQPAPDQRGRTIRDLQDKLSAANTEIRALRQMISASGASEPSSQQTAEPAVPSTDALQIQSYIETAREAINDSKDENKATRTELLDCALRSLSKAVAALAAQPLPAPTSERVEAVLDAAQAFAEALDRGNADFARDFTPLTVAVAALVPAPAASVEPDMRAICEALGFDPTNHHNASKCPYCRPAASVEDSAPMDGGFHEGYAEGFDAGKAAASVEDAGRVPGVFMPVAWADVISERQRQADGEGYTREHDDEHDDGALSAAASTYALAASDKLNPARRGIEFGGGRRGPSTWPWSRDAWKPAPPRRMLVKAGALILAEIERLDRAARAGDVGAKQ